MTSNMTTVLVVEDEPLIRMNAVAIVNSAGFPAVEAGSADEAIGIIEKRPDIALVFTDVHMPGTMDGIKLCFYISGRWPQLRLIVASGKANVTEEQLPGGAMFFTKPYTESSIAGAVNQLLASGYH